MSTRRARIKAVAALPQRRRNADKSVNKASEQARNLAENVIKSPKDSSTAVDKHSGKSPARAAPSPRKPSPRKSPRAPLTPDVAKVPSEWKVPTPTPLIPEKRSSTPLRDKTDTNKPVPRGVDGFISPQARASPLRRRSPVVRTPVIEVDIGVERLITPHKRLVELQEDAQKDRASENRENILSSKRTSERVAANSAIEIKNIADGYNSPNTPENDVMDGIVPLKPVSNAPKPIDLLKNEIISENAEVLFDPIVPLPSPTKARQKLRPVPRLGPMRRNSIPGSTSESEDESRRVVLGGALTPVPARHRHDSHTPHSTMSHPNRDVSRVRNDSMCSSQTALQTPAPASPLREKNVTKSRRTDVSRRMTAMRRRKESIQRDKLTMFDLIFYNPLSNPIVPDQDEVNAKEATKKEEEQRKQESSKKEEAHEEAADTADSAPVPQIKLGPNGEIILDEQSLVIKQSEQRKVSEWVVREGSWVSASGRVYRRAARTADWSDAETVRFYRALAALGTDFSLMAALFPGRSRRDIKLKFKKEERLNLALIDKALRSNSEWNADRLESEFAEERRLAEKQAQELKEQLQEEKRLHKEQAQLIKEMTTKQSKGSKALGMSVIPASNETTNESSTANDLLSYAMKPRSKRIPVEVEVPAPIPPRHIDPPPTSKIVKINTPTNPEFATLTQVRYTEKTTPKLPKVGIPRDMATIQRTAHKSPVVFNALPSVPADITPGSLVVLTVDDPKAPSQKAIHTYIKQADGSIASIILDPSVMSSLVSFVKKDTPKAGSTSTMSPSSVVSDRTNTPPVGASPNKRKRVASYTITDL